MLLSVGSNGIPHLLAVPCSNMFAYDPCMLLPITPNGCLLEVQTAITSPGCTMKLELVEMFPQVKLRLLPILDVFKDSVVTEFGTTVYVLFPNSLRYTWNTADEFALVVLP